MKGGRKPACRKTYVFAKRARRRGLTLMETALTTVIVGLAVTALVKLVIATTQQDAISQRATAASLLAENVREMMAGLPFTDPAGGTTGFGPEAGETSLGAFNDVDDFDGFDSETRTDLPGGSPRGVVDAARRVIVDPTTAAVPAELANFRQQIVVEPVDSTQFATVLPKTVVNRNVVRITVTVSYQAGGSGPWVAAATLRWLKTR